MTIGAAASKSDAAHPRHRRVLQPDHRLPAGGRPHATRRAEYVSPGVTSSGPQTRTTRGTELAGSERFVDYGGFSYNRSQTFKGSVTWLDVPTLTWKVSRITDVVPFTNLSRTAAIGTRTLTGITAFAQLADDVRALCNFIPDNTFIPGFFMDVPGVDTTAAPAQGDPRPGGRPRHPAEERLPDPPLPGDRVAAQPVGAAASSTPRSCA